MTIPLPQLYDCELMPAGRVHPSKVSLDLTLAPLSTACMELPPGEIAVQPDMFVELFDLSGSAGFFRVCEIETICGAAARQRIRLEHALCTLSDCLISGYTAIGGDSCNTGQTIAYLLQEQMLWRLGDCDANEHFAYTFENENLLTALTSVAASLPPVYRWVCDFSTRPWTLHLRRMPESAACECRLNRGAQSVSIKVDRSRLCTRLYPFGYGEGADQLTIASVNGGLKYLEADTAGLWGTTARVWTAPDITDALTLKSAASSVLAKCKEPVVTVSLDALDLSAMTGERLDRFALGDLCRMPLPDSGVFLEERIIAIRRPDVYGRPEAAQLTLANRAADTGSEISQLNRTAAVNALYTQGAPSQYEVSFADNADEAHPARMRFYLDEDVIHVNAVKVRWEVSPFRGYTKGTAAGGEGQVSTESKTLTHTAATQGKADDLYTGYYAGSGDVSHRHYDEHTHALSLRLNIPALQASLPGHSHESLPGITEANAPAGSVVITVDGTEVAGTGMGGTFDAAPCLSRDSRGRVQRGVWHTIDFTPSGPARITASAHVRTFIRSLTGANL